MLPAVSSVDREVIYSSSWPTDICWSSAFAVFLSSFLISSKVNSVELIEQNTTQILPVEPGAENFLNMLVL